MPGDPVSFTATVTASNANVSGEPVYPTGMVTFYSDDDGNPADQIGSPVTLVNGSATSDAISSLPLGNHTIYADYSGGPAATPATVGSFNSSQGMADQKVSLASTTSVSSSSPTSVFGQSVTFTATVSASSGPPTGMVTFYYDDDGNPADQIGGPVTLVNGTATSASISSLLATGHTIYADYSGDSNFSSSQGTTTQTVYPATPSVTVNPVTISYGTALANSQLSGSASYTVNGTVVSVSGVFSYTSAAGTVLNPSGTAYSENVTFTPTDSTDYTTASTTVMVTVGQATPSVTVSPVSITYGTALANSQLGGTATFLVNGVSTPVAGTYTYTSAAGTILNASGTAYSENVTFTPTDSTDYTTASSTVMVTVGQATPSVTVSPVSITYGTALANSQLGGTATFLVNGVSTPVAGTYTYTSAAGTILNASGTAYSENVTFTPTDSTDYTTASSTVMVTVGQATPSVTVSPVSITYGTALANSQLGGTATFLVNGVSTPVAGTYTYTSAAGTILNASGTAYSENVTFTPTDSTDYTTASTTVMVTVGQATPSITVNPVSITYGTALANSQLGGTATFLVNGVSTPVAGTYTYTSAAGTVLNASGTAYSENVTFTPTDSTDYTTASTTVQVTVGQATPSVTVSPVSITYGTALANSQLGGTATFLVNGVSTPVAGTYTYTSAAGTVLNASGTAYSENVTFTPTDSTDYTTATSTVMVTVGQATPSVTVSPVSITYGTALANSQLGGTATFLVNGVSTPVAGTYTYTSAAGTILNASGTAYSENVTFTPTDSTDYTTATSTVSVTVGQATPSVTVNPVSITYGTALANSQLGGTATFLVNGVSTPVAGTYTYTSAAGTILNASGTAYSENVTFTPTDSTDYTTASTTVMVTVGQATPSVTVSPVSITYGTALANSQLGGTATFLVNGVSTPVAGTYTYTSAAGTVLNASGTAYSENVTFTPTDSTDYTTASTTVSVTVGQATPSVTVSPVSITYGTALANSQLGGTATFLVNGVSTPVAGTYTYTSAAGTILNASGTAYSENVTFTPTDSTDYTTASSTVMVTVGQATPSVTVSPVSITYGTALANSQLGGTATFLVNGVSTPVAGTYTYTSAAGTVLNASGTAYSENVTFTPTDSTDYTTASTTVQVTVGQATPSVTVSPVSITYGTALANSQLGGTATFLVNGVSTPVAGTYTYTSAAGTILNASGTAYSENVTFTPTDSIDYTTATSTVMVTVGQATPSVTVSPVSITYGTALANSQLGGTATFLVNGVSTPVAGTYTYTSAAGTILNASGTAYSENVTFTPTDSTDYTTASTTVMVTVGQATPSVTVSPVSITYGTALANSQLGGTATFLVNGVSTPVAGTYTYTSAAGTILNASGTAYSENVTFTPTDSTDYTTASTTVMVTVGQATPSVTVSPVSITYGTALANSQLGGTATFLVNGVSTPVAGTYTYTSAAGTILNASGTAYSENVTFTPTDSIDYTTASTTVSVTVGQATPSVTVNPVSITYGTALANSQLGGTATFLVNGVSTPVAGTYTYTSAAGTILNASGTAYSENVTFTPTDSTDYTTASTTVMVTVGQATPSVTVSPVSITYGTALANSQLGGTATFLVNGVSTPVAGTYTYTSAAGTILNASGTAYSENVTFTPTDSTDYTTASTTVMVTVGQATPSVTVSPVSITYGTALANSQLGGTATFLVNGVSTPVAGTYTYTSAAGTILNASGTAYSENVTFTPTDSIDYTTASTTVSVTVNPATASFSNLISPSISYGTANTTLSGTLAGATGASVSITLNTVTHSATVGGDGSFSSVFSTATLGVSSYSVSFTFSGNSQFSATSSTSTLTVTPAPLTITASNQTLTYGFGGTSASLGTSAFTTLGLQNGETVGSVTLTTDATKSHSGNYNVGTWHLTPSAASGGNFNPSNYSISYTTGTLIINQALLTPSVTVSNKTYDGTGSGTITRAV